MKVGVYSPPDTGLSVRNYIDSVTRELSTLGVRLVFFSREAALPREVDCYWDPRAGRPGPYGELKQADAPVIASFHGAAHLVLSSVECFGAKPSSRAYAHISRWRTRYQWRRMRGHCDAFIAVSKYAKWEAETFLGLPREKCFVAYHGVDFDGFSASETTDNTGSPYILHVSQYQPKKNVDRIIDAYSKINVPNKPSLVVVAPGYRQERHLPIGVKLIRNPHSHAELAGLYREALAFVFCSLHETFGMPILEAMAAGCPVITSNTTSCPEIAGDAGLQVSPRSVHEIAVAMERVIVESQTRLELTSRGLLRANEFTWKRSAQQHLNVFETVVGHGKRT